jgi:predicted CoA-binding protein
MDPKIEQFVQDKRVAVVGASRTGKKFGNTVATELKQRGYQVFLVHPEASEIDGETCYPNLAALQGKVDSVVICVSPRQSAGVIRDAASAGITHVWLQQGAQSNDALEAAKEVGVSPVVNKCILMYAPPVKSIHGFHRTINKIFGQL